MSRTPYVLPLVLVGAVVEAFMGWHGSRPAPAKTVTVVPAEQTAILASLKSRTEEYFQTTAGGAYYQPGTINEKKRATACTTEIASKSHDYECAVMATTSVYNWIGHAHINSVYHPPGHISLFVQVGTGSDYSHDSRYELNLVSGAVSPAIEDAIGDLHSGDLVRFSGRLALTNGCVTKAKEDPNFYSGTSTRPLQYLKFEFTDISFVAAKDATIVETHGETQ